MTTELVGAQRETGELKSALTWACADRVGTLRYMDAYSTANGPAALKK
jgi:hypothetical protein